MSEELNGMGKARAHPDSAPQNVIMAADQCARKNCERPACVYPMLRVFPRLILGEVAEVKMGMWATCIECARTLRAGDFEWMHDAVCEALHAQGKSPDVDWSRTELLWLNEDGSRASI